MIAEINLVLALAIWLLVLGIGVSHFREHGFRHRTALLGLVVVTLATINLFSSVVAPLGLQGHVEWFRFGTGIFRGVALVLLLAYAWGRWDER